MSKLNTIKTIPDELRTHAGNRSEAVRVKLKKTMNAIEREIEEHDGLYPGNGGTLNQAEVCRRAGVAQVTLQGKKHKATTKVWVDEWLREVLKRISQGKKNVRKVVTERVNDIKQDLEESLQRYHEAELEYSAAQTKIAALEKEVRSLQESNALLRQQLAERTRKSTSRQG